MNIEFVCMYWHENIIIILSILNVVNYTNWFYNIKPNFDFLDKFNTAVISYSFMFSVAYFDTTSYQSEWPSLKSL